MDHQYADAGGYAYADGDGDADGDADGDEGLWDSVGSDPSPESDAKPESPVASISPTLTAWTSEGEDPLSPALPKRKQGLGTGLGTGMGTGTGNGPPAVPTVPKVVVAVEKEREKLLNATGDFCGGRGGELGRRLEAWLYVSGDADGRVGLGRRWEGEGEED